MRIKAFIFLNFPSPGSKVDKREEVDDDTAVLCTLSWGTEGEHRERNSWGPLQCGGSKPLKPSPSASPCTPEPSSSPSPNQYQSLFSPFQGRPLLTEPKASSLYPSFAHRRRSTTTKESWPIELVTGPGCLPVMSSTSMRLNVALMAYTSASFSFLGNSHGSSVNTSGVDSIR